MSEMVGNLTLTFILKTKRNAIIICLRKENNMWKKLIIKLASKHITDAYLTGFEEGVEFQKSKHTGTFKKGNIPWNKGKKKGEKNGK
jgi:hypothetical protein